MLVGIIISNCLNIILLGVIVFLYRKARTFFRRIEDSYQMICIKFDKTRDEIKELNKEILVLKEDLEKQKNIYNI